MPPLSFESLERRDVLSANLTPEVPTAPETAVQAVVAEVEAGFAESIPDDVYHLADLPRREVAIWDDTDIVHVVHGAYPADDVAAFTDRENCLACELIPKLEIEQTASYAGAKAAYLKYTLKDVMVSSYQAEASGNDEAAAIAMGRNFEEVKLNHNAPIGSTAPFSAYLDVVFDSSL